MPAGRVYMDHHHQGAGIVYRNICTQYGLKKLRSTLETCPKVVENDWAKIQSDLQIQNYKQVMAQKPSIVVIDKADKRAVMIDDVVRNNSIIRKKEHVELEKAGRTAGGNVTSPS